MTKKKEKAVVVTTQHRGVFFGYARETSGETIFLRASRVCVYWDESVKGFGGLGAKGPGENCRVGPPVDMEVRDITAVIFCSEEATRAWESGPWG